MISRCLYCYKELDAKVNGDYHAECIKAFYGGYFSDIDPQNGHVDPLVGFISKN